MKFCDWCNGKGVVIDKSWGSIVIVKCVSCHHEWEEVTTEVQRLQKKAVNACPPKK